MYITFKSKGTTQQLNFEDIYTNMLKDPTFIPLVNTEHVGHTYTKYLTEYNAAELSRVYNLQAMKAAIVLYHKKYIADTELLDLNMIKYYDTFYIPKRSGGMRRIDAPKTQLMDALREMKTLFEKDLKVLTHDAAYAYVKQRSTVDALAVHQSNQSKWFLKLDIKDFFPSCNLQTILQQLSKIFPFKILMEDPIVLSRLTDMIKLCLLGNTLPQGTPMSPLLTNLIMTAFDYDLKIALREHDKQYLVYTRYADDILISCKYNFNWQKIVETVETYFKVNDYSFKIKKEKTRYGSSAGRNWNLGLMLNKDNQITVGYKNKQRLKATIFSFLNDFTNNIRWSIIDTQVMLGNISYYHKVEPDYVDHIISKYETKFRLILQNCIKDTLKGNLTGEYPAMNA